MFAARPGAAAQRLLEAALGAPGWEPLTLGAAGRRGRAAPARRRRRPGAAPADRERRGRQPAVPARARARSGPELPASLVAAVALEVAALDARGAGAARGRRRRRRAVRPRAGRGRRGAALPRRSPRWTAWWPPTWSARARTAARSRSAIRWCAARSTPAPRPAGGWPHTSAPRPRSSAAAPPRRSARTTSCAPGGRATGGDRRHPRGRRSRRPRRPRPRRTGTARRCGCAGDGPQRAELLALRAGALAAGGRLESAHAALLEALALAPSLQARSRVRARGDAARPPCRGAPAAARRARGGAARAPGRDRVRAGRGRLPRGPDGQLRRWAEPAMRAAAEAGDPVTARRRGGARGARRALGRRSRDGRSPRSTTRARGWAGSTTRRWPRAPRS